MADGRRYQQTHREDDILNRKLTGDELSPPKLFARVRHQRHEQSPDTVGI